MNKAVAGRSGVVHEFSEVEFDGVQQLTVKRVADIFQREVNEVDVLAFYIKVLDTAAQSGEIQSPSFTEGAKKFAEEYGVNLVIADRVAEQSLARQGNVSNVIRQTEGERQEFQSKRDETDTSDGRKGFA